MPTLAEIVTEITSLFGTLGLGVVVAAGAIIGLLGALVGGLVRKTR